MRKQIITAVSLLLFSNFYCQSIAQEISPQEAQRFSAYFSNGMDYLQKQQFPSAIIEFKKVLRIAPYDETVQDQLIQAYYAYAQYFKQTTKEYKKALVQYKSAVFYGKYWSRQTVSVGIANIISNSIKEIEELERKLLISQNPTQRLQDAKYLKAQGDLAAAGYNYQLLKNSQYKETAYENLGNIYKNLNNPAIAMDYYKNAIDINPKNPRLHFAYGIILDDAKNYEASIEQYNLALQYGENSPELLEILENKWTHNIVNNPDNAQNYISLGAIYQKEGRLEEAKTQYLKAYGLDDKDTTVLYNLASLYIQQKNYIDAIAIYDKLLALNPKDVEIYEYKAQAYENLNKFEDVIKQYEAILAIKPNDKNAKEKIDYIVYNKFSGQKLQTYLISKAQNNPNSYEAQFNCALELHKNKEYAQAIEYYKKALELNPSKEDSYINLASIYIEQKNYNNANLICQKGLLISPNNKTLNQYLKEIKDYMLNSQYELASKLMEENKYQEALNVYLKLNNKSQEVKSAIALCYWQLGDYATANKYYLEILSQNPNDIDSTLNSALAYYNLKDLINSRKMANKVLLLDKENIDAKNILEDINETEMSSILEIAVAKYEKQDYNGSLALLNKYLSANPNSEYALYYKGMCYDELKKPSEAIKQYRLIISKNQSFTNAYYSLALDLDNQENYKEAIENYEQYLTLKGKEQDETVSFVKERIKELKDYLNTVSKK